MDRLLRLIDANANRAREAMRVMEDAARFLLDDAELTADLKTMRHDLAHALATLGDLTLHRDTPGDVGTAIATDSERMRPGPADVATAAGKRLSEALRAIEEFLKIDHPEAATRIEALRYRGYTLEARLAARLHRPDPCRWRLGVLITADNCQRDWREVVRSCLHAAGTKPERLCFQLREPDRPDGDLLIQARELVALVHQHVSEPDTDHNAKEPAPRRSPAGGRATVIINDRVDIALAAGTDGVHLGQSDLPIAAARQLTGSAPLIGASTHNLEEANAAVSAGCDYCGVGAMFRSTTKAEVTPTGLDYLRRFREAHPDVPHLAIGGIDVENVSSVVAAGARAIAVSRCVCAASDPEAVTAALLSALEA